MAHPSNRRRPSTKNERIPQHDVMTETVLSNSTLGTSASDIRSDEIPTRRSDNTKQPRHTPHLLKHSKPLSKHSHQVPQVRSSRLTRRQDAGFGNATVAGTNSSTIETGILIGSGSSESAVTTATLSDSAPVVQVTVTVLPLPVNSTSSIDAPQNTSISAVLTSSFPSITTDQLVGASTTTTFNTTLPLSTSLSLPTSSISTTTNTTDIITTTYGAQTVLQTIVQPTLSATTLYSRLTTSTIIDTNATSITALPIFVSTAVPPIPTTSVLPAQLSTLTNGTVVTLASAVSSVATAITDQQSPTSASWVVINGTTVLATSTNAASANPSLLSEAPLAGTFLSTTLLPQVASTWTTINGSGLWVATTPTTSPVAPTPYVVIFGGPMSTQAVLTTADSMSSTVSVAASSIPQAILSTAAGLSSTGTITAASVSPTGLNTIYVIPVAASDLGSSSVVYETASLLSGAATPVSSLPAGSSGSSPTSRANIVTYSGVVTLGSSSTAVPIVIPVGSSGSGSSTTIYALLPFSTVASSVPNPALSTPSGAGLVPELTTISTTVSGTPTTFITQIGSVAGTTSPGATIASSASLASPTSSAGASDSAGATATLFPVASAASSSPSNTGTISIPSSAADSSERGSISTTDASATGTRTGSSALVFTSSGVVYTSTASGIASSSVSGTAPTSSSTLTPISNRVNDTAPAGTIAGSVVGGLAGISIILLLALLGLRFLKRRTETSAALAGSGAAGTGAAAMIPARGAPVTPPMAERGFQRIGGRKLPSRFSPGIEGPTTRFSGTPTPAPSSFYPSGAPSGSSFGTFGSPLLGAAAGGGAGAGFAAASTIPEEPEDPFADPIWNDDSPVRPGQVNSPLLGSQMGSPQRPGTRGSAMSRFTEDVL